MDGGKGPQVHNCEYVRARNKLIPEAERLTWALLSKKYGIGWSDRPEARNEENRVFLSQMRELAHDRFRQ